MSALSQLRDIQKNTPEAGVTKVTEVVLSVLSPHPQACFSEHEDVDALPDDRITCQDCRRLKPGGLCSSPEWAPRYHPQAERPQRCVEFLPKPGDADQRTGKQRWPEMVEAKL